MRLRNKINLYTAVLFVCLLLIMNISIYLVFSNLMIANERNQIKEETEKVAKDISQGIKQINPNELLRAYVPINGKVQVIAENEASLISGTSITEKQLSERKTEYYQGETSKIITFQQKKYAFASIPIIWSDGSVVNLQLTSSIADIEEILSTLRIVLIIVTLIAMIPVILSSRILSNLITRPIQSMIATMKEIQRSGQFKRLTLNKKSKDELFEMGSTFNHMIDLLKTNFEKQEQFVANASHELKTPLTIIESYADLLKRRGKDRPELFDESVEAIHSEAIRMREMTEQLLLLARHDDQWKLEMKQMNLPETVTESAKVFQNAYQRKINIQSTEDIFAITDEQKLKQLLFIFFDNARKYSEDEITVHIGKLQESPYIKIEDRGIGIPKSDLPKVFDRFFRVDKARSRKQGGTGLGLSMAKEIADAINVRIELDSLEGVGTTVTLFFSANSHFPKL
ncbi:two-component sensor histidine kinase [Bacillus sp. 7586-K]|uniref:histidine kinase n=2 Tax=Metabacillus niabensis TaxID=324854 RepID=A0ABT9Z5R5_9BACI|nr:HAMP domain-containing sensor histidine kinase [Metabacillus niabensis]MDQ0227181.1 signal transduction histidine kinase [Metabacillus niabensis]PAD69568.1 two-component sensor histidine kinase [Bacillus sp. 7586-K]